MRGVSKKCVDKRAPSSLTRFLSSSPWDPHQLNKNRLSYLQSLKQLKAVKEGIISLDDTISKKHGKAIKSAGYHYSHTENKTVLGQNIVALHYKDDKKEICLSGEVYLNKKRIAELRAQGEEVEFNTRIEMAEGMIQEIHDLGIKGQTIVMDSWFVTRDLIDKIKELNYHWVGRVKSNRICFDKDGNRQNIKEVARNIPDDCWQETESLYETALKKENKPTQYIASKTVNLKSLGTLKMVFIKPSLEEEVVLFIGTDRFNLSAREILELYTRRWRIETFFRDCKQNLNFSGYMGRSILGFERFLCLVFIAYSFIKYLSLMGFWGRHNLPRRETFGAELDNYHQLCFEHFISTICEVNSKLSATKELISYFRDYYYGDLEVPSLYPDDQPFYDLQAHILTAVG